MRQPPAVFSNALQSPRAQTVEQGFGQTGKYAVQLRRWFAACFRRGLRWQICLQRQPAGALIRMQCSRFQQQLLFGSCSVNQRINGINTGLRCGMIGGAGQGSLY
jgi:hypothetical protein